MVSLFTIDFLTFAIAIVAMVSLGLLVFFKGERNLSDSFFLFFTTISALWGTLNYANYQFDNPTLILWIIRAIMFLATLQALSFFLLIYSFPKGTAPPKRVMIIMSLVVAAIALLTLTPFVFSGIKFESGGVSQPVPAPGIALFGLVAVSLVVGGVYILIRRTIKSSGLEKLQLKYLLAGATTMFALIIVFNFLMSVIFQNTSFIFYLLNL